MIDPEERRRRARATTKARAKVMKLLRPLGFRQREDGNIAMLPNPVVVVVDLDDDDVRRLEEPSHVLEYIYFKGVRVGAESAKRRLRDAIGLI